MLRVLTDPEPSLRQPSRDLRVDEITTPEFQLFLDELVDTMQTADGVGIAAPQVGKNVRVIVLLTNHGPECYLNPEITKKSESLVESEEGCLSVPGKFGIVERAKRISIRAFNRHGRKIELEAKHLSAIIFQHEIDHLNGILFIDKAKKIIKTSSTRI